MERPDHPSAAPWSRTVRLADLAGTGPEPFDLAPDADARAAVAEALGIRAVRKLRFRGRLAPEGRRDWRLEAELGATVVQDCVVTLAPVTTRIDESVLRRYVAGLPAPDPGEAEMPEDDTVDPLPEAIDLGQVMVEALALALPLYPKAEGADLGEMAVTEPGKTPLTDETVRPFAELKALRDRMRDKG